MPGIMSYMDPGTIDPAELNPAGSLAPPSAGVRFDTSPRGVKRSRSPEVQAYGADAEQQEEVKPRKRGRPPSKAKALENAAQAAQSNRRAEPTPPQHTPRQSTSGLPQISPTQASPLQLTPSGKGVKALPTVRDHTTGQLNPEGDEYITREHDEEGEKKVTPTGHLMDGREYRMRTFYVPKRGKKLFMLATECARVLAYRDSYLLFNKNKSLHKIIASPEEKDDLINQEILPPSYRSRQIALVTARSMYRQFGARVIVDGRRVKDDYWEAKARKQGFTENDLASEKRPNTTKAKEAAPDTGQANANAIHRLATATSNVEYQAEDHEPPPPSFSVDFMANFYGNVQRPRQDITGTSYHDRTTSSSHPEIVNQASQAADFNKNVLQQRAIRGQYLEEGWNREHKVQSPEIPPQQQLAPENIHGQPALVSNAQSTSPARQMQNLPPPNQPQMVQQPPQHQPHQQAHQQARQQQARQQQVQQQQAYQQQQSQHHRRSSSAVANPQLYGQQSPHHQPPNQPGVPQSPLQRMQQSIPQGQMGHPQQQPQQQRAPQNFSPYGPGGQMAAAAAAQAQAQQQAQARAQAQNPSAYGYMQNMQNPMWQHGVGARPQPQSSPLRQAHTQLPPGFSTPQQQHHAQQQQQQQHGSPMMHQQQMQHQQQHQQQQQQHSPQANAPPSIPQQFHHPSQSPGAMGFHQQPGMGGGAGAMPMSQAQFHQTPGRARSMYQPPVTMAPQQGQGQAMSPQQQLMQQQQQQQWAQQMGVGAPHSAGGPQTGWPGF